MDNNSTTYTTIEGINYPLIFMNGYTTTMRSISRSMYDNYEQLPYWLLQTISNVIFM